MQKAVKAMQQKRFLKLKSCIQIVEKMPSYLNKKLIE